MGVEKPATRARSYEEIRALWPLWTEYGTVASLALQVGVLLGQRKMEISGTSWSELEGVDDIGGRWWELPGERAKNGRDHRIYLAPQTVAVVQAAQSESLPWVFPSPKRTETPLKDVRKAIEWSSERAGVEGWTFKTLRATWATRASEIGIEAWLISEVLNQASATVTQRHYMHSQYQYADQKRAAMIRYADRLSVELGEERSKVLPFA